MKCDEYQKPCSQENCSGSDKKHKGRVGYAYVPFSRLGKLYNPEAALMAGTVFPELNLTIDEYERGLYNGV